jgi:hypothetical protein
MAVTDCVARTGTAGTGEAICSADDGISAGDFEYVVPAARHEIAANATPLKITASSTPG